MRKFLLFLFSFSFYLFSCSFASLSSDSDSNKISLKWFAFQDSSVSIGIGETKHVRLNLLGNLIFDKDVSYSVSQEGIVNISGTSISGCTVTGIGEGSVIITARCYFATSYVEIKVGSENTTIDPYIVLPFSVLKMENGEKKSVIASLYGGSASDNNSFVWSTDSSLITCTGLNNTCVIETHGYGVSRVNVSNPKAKYSSSFIVVADNEEKKAKYLTTSDNIIKLKSNSQGVFTVELEGGTSSELLSVNYSVVEGRDVISIIPNMSKCYIQSLKEGSAQIKVSLSGVESLLITVIVSDDILKPYIECSGSFYISGVNEEHNIVCNVIGDVSDNWKNKFTYKVEDPSVLQVVQTNNTFHVTTLKEGRSKLYVYNSFCDNEKIIQFIVSDEQLISKVYYIQASDSFVYLEEGGDDYELSANLIGGNESDANNFKFTVSDSSIISASVTDGTVSYSRGLVSDGYEAKCLISPKKSGTATVKIENDKTEFYSVVTFRVYPKGVINQKQVSLNGPAYVKVETGKTENVSLEVKDNADSNYGTLLWNVKDDRICSVTSDMLNGILTGLTKGITELIVFGENIRSKFISTVICGSKAELDEANILYADKKYIELEKNNTCYLEIKSLKEVSDGSLSVSVNDRSVCIARISGNVLVVQGIKEGDTEIIVRSSEISDFNLIFYVSCTDSDVSYDYPYVLDFPEFVGCVLGETVVVEGGLINGYPLMEENIEYYSENQNVCTVNGNGRFVTIKAVGEGECYVTVKHPKARNSARICVYTAINQSILNTKIVMTSNKTNYIANKGDRLSFNLSINNTDRLNDIVWKISDMSLATIDGFKESCICDVLGEGNFTVTACVEQTELKFYVSCISSNSSNYEKIVKAPSIIEILTGETKTVKLNCSNLDSTEMQNFEWSCSSDGLGLVSNNSECRIKAEKKGCYEINIVNNLISFEKTVTVIVCDDEQDFKTSYVLGLDDTYFIKQEGNVFDVNLKFGTYSLPESLWNNIKWKSSSSCVELVSNGLNCTVFCRSEGQAVISVTSKDCVNSVSFKVDVFSVPESDSLYGVSVKRVIKLVKGNSEDCNFSCYNIRTSEPVKDYKGFFIYSDDESVCQVSYSSNFIRFIGKEKGSAKVYITNELYSVKIPVIVNVYESQNLLDSSFVCSTEKDNYLISLNEEKKIPLLMENYSENIISDIKLVSSDENNLSVSLNGSNIILTGNKDGNYAVSILYKNKKVYLFNVSVTSKKDSSYVQILAESIISLTVDQKYTPAVSVTGGTDYTLNLENSNNSVVMKPEDSHSVYGYQVGRDEIIVRSGSSYRVIRAGVFKTEEEAKNYHEMNISNRYRKLNVGDSVSVCPVFFSDGEIKDTVYEDLSNNNVVSMSVSDGILTVKGINEGIQEIKVFNSDFEPILIYFEVHGDHQYTETEQAETVIDTMTLFTYQNVYYIENSDTDGLFLTVYEKGYNPSGKSNEYYWNISDETLIDYEFHDNYIKVYPKGLDGIVTVTCSSSLCSNIVKFTVRIGSLYQKNESKIKYIYSTLNTVGLTYNGESVTVPVRLVNMDGFSVSDIHIESDSNNICSVSKEISQNIMYLKFVPVSVGYGRLTLTHPACDVETCIDYIVYEAQNSELVYLTTNDNYIIVKTDETKNCSVQLKNKTESVLSRFTWNVSDTSVCSVIGSGSDVLIRGFKEGKTDITVSHPDSRNDVVIHVVVSDVVSHVSYLNCSSNIIETTVSGIMDSFKVNLIGKSEECYSNIHYRSLDETILNVVGNNDYCYYRGLKKGIAQIEITYNGDDVIDPLLVTVIVEETAQSDSYLSSQNNFLYFLPFGSSKTITIEYNGKNSFTASKLQWYLYSQDLAGNVEGNVCTLTASGSKGVIVPQNTGIAKIRVVYPPENLKYNIIVFVSNTEKLAFQESSVTVYKGDSVFAQLDCPDFTSNMNSFISFETDNENVCSAVGTSRVCYITGNGVGTALVTAKNGYDNSDACIACKVLDPNDENNVKIFTNETAVSMNPRSSSVNLIAVLSGKDIIDSDNDDILWNISGDAPVSIYPSKGREVILSVKNDGNEIIDGESVITLTHSKCPEGYKKSIYVSLKELSNYFTLDMTDGAVDVGSTFVISSFIKGASLGDYEKVKWSVDGLEVDADGNPIETVKLMNTSGQSCTVYGIKDGTARVTAYYNGDIKTVNVIVKGTRYFSFETGVVYLYPGKEIELEYQVKPSTVIPTFFMSDSNGSNASDFVSYSVDYDNNKLKIKSLKEGNITVTGMATGVGTATCTLYSRYNPKLINRYKNSGGEYTTNVYFELKDENEANYSGNTVEIPIVCYPPIYYFDVEADGFNVDKDSYTITKIENHRDEEEEGNDGLSWIKIQFNKELPSSGMELLVKQYTDSACTTLINDNELRYNICANYTYSDDNYFDIILKRNDGVYSFPHLGDEYTFSSNKINDKSIGPWGDGETHYIIISPKHKGQYLKNISLSIDPLYNNKNLLKPQIKVVNSWEENDNGIVRYVYEVTSENDYGFDCQLNPDSKDWSPFEKGEENLYDREFYNRFGIHDADWNIAGKYSIKSSDLISEGVWTTVSCSSDEYPTNPSCDGCGNWTYAQLGLKGYSFSPIVMYGKLFLGDANIFSIRGSSSITFPKPSSYSFYKLKPDSQIESDDNYKTVFGEYTNSWGDLFNSGSTTREICVVVDDMSKKVIYGVKRIKTDKTWWQAYYSNGAGEYKHSSEINDEVYNDEQLKILNEYIMNGNVKLIFKSDSKLKTDIQADDNFNKFIKQKYPEETESEISSNFAKLAKNNGFSFENPNNYMDIFYNFYNSLGKSFPIDVESLCVGTHIAEQHLKFNKDGNLDFTGSTLVSHPWYIPSVVSCPIVVTFNGETKVYNYGDFNLKLKRPRYKAGEMSINFNMWKNSDWINSKHGFNYPSSDKTVIRSVENVNFKINLSTYNKDNVSTTFRADYQIRNCYRNYPKTDITHPDYESKLMKNFD